MRNSLLRRFISLPIRNQLLTGIFFLMLPVVALVLHVQMDQREDAITGALGSARELANSIANEKQQLVAGAQQLAMALSQLPDVQHPNPKKLAPLLRRILRLNPQYANISIIDAYGMTWASAIPMAKPFSVADRLYFRKAKATGKFSSGEYAIGKLSGIPFLAFAHPLLDSKGAFAGIIAISLDLDYFRRLPASSRFPSGTSVVLIDHQGTVLARTLDNERFRGKPFKPDVFKRIVELNDGSSFRALGLDNVERFSSHRKLKLDHESSPYLYVRTGIPVNTVVGAANMEMIKTTLVAFSFILATFMFACLIGKVSIVDRVNAFEMACQRVADGDLQSRVSEMVSGGDLGRLGTMFDNMAERLHKREKELIASRDMLQELNHRLETAREQERLHISREVHDVLGQSLTALNLDVSWFLRHVPLPSPEAAARGSEIQTLIYSIINEVHSITAQLSPPLLEVGLAAAIEWHAKEFERRSGISCLLMLDETASQELWKDDATMLFRIMQEALTNVVRHAEASEVSISLCSRMQGVILEIADDGIGISEEAMASPTAFGILGMRERARMCGAAVSIKGSPGRGTIVKLEIPHKRQKGSEA